MEKSFGSPHLYRPRQLLALHILTTVRVQGSGFRVQGSGFRVQGLGFRVQGSGFRVHGPRSTARAGCGDACKVVGGATLERLGRTQRQVMSLWGQVASLGRAALRACRRRRRALLLRVWQLEKWRQLLKRASPDPPLRRRLQRRDLHRSVSEVPRVLKGGRQGEPSDATQAAFAASPGMWATHTRTCPGLRRPTAVTA